jgi:hypothetical protein
LPDALITVITLIYYNYNIIPRKSQYLFLPPKTRAQENRPDANARSLRRLNGGFVSLYRIRADFADQT